jgi:hypothetical protein
MNLPAVLHARLFSCLLPQVLLCVCALVLYSAPASAAFPEKITEQGKAFTVRVFNMNSSGEMQGTGSGFFISKDGHVATNCHVVEGGAKFGVTFVSGDRLFIAKAGLVAIDEKEDLAILKTRLFPGAKPATLAVGDAGSNQEVMALGFPGVLDEIQMQIQKQNARGLQQIAPDEFRANKAELTIYTPSTFTGNVGKMLGEKVIAHSAKISEGNSGGPLMDVSGRVLGVNTGGKDNKAGVDYAVAVHSSRLAELARQHQVAVLLSSAKATTDSSALPAAGILLVVGIAALSVVTFLLVLRRPRAALADGRSRFPSAPSVAAVPVAPRPSPTASPPARSGAMILRGRDPAGASYRLDLDPEAFRRSGGRLVIGRSRELCQLHLPHDSVSRRHAALIWSGGTLCIEDLNSGNGTLVNGQPVPLGAAARPLRPGERITLGEVELLFDVLA